MYTLCISDYDVKLNENVANSKNWVVFASIKFKMATKILISLFISCVDVRLEEIILPIILFFYS